jgi:anti-sigma regulatory factor (Ser/Thr protein kinase)
MTSTAPSLPRRIAAFTVASEPGNERLARAMVADAVAGLGLTDARLERLKTAVAEATMNAIEHGNHNRAEIPVEVEVTQSGAEIVVAISDSGASDASDAEVAPAEHPDLDLKLAGAQSPRGWGLFLIRNMVDVMRITTDGARHTVWLTMRTGTPAAKENGHEEHV